VANFSGSDNARLHLVESRTRTAVTTSRGRITQVTAEALVGPGIPNALVTQAAVEVLVRRSAKAGQDTASLQLLESASVFGTGTASATFPAASRHPSALMFTDTTKAVAHFRLEKRDEHGNLIETIECGEDMDDVCRTQPDGTQERIPLDQWRSRMQALPSPPQR
jgi:hypothetical protein